MTDFRIANQRLYSFWKPFIDAGHQIIPIYPMEENALGEMSCTCNKPHCKSPGKHPIADKWQLKRLPESYLARNISNRAQAYGLSVEKLLVVDVDPRNGGLTGLKNLEDALDMNLEDIAGLTVKTGGGGYHFFFNAPDDVRMVSQMKEFPGVDFMHGFHYVVGLGSGHRSGGVYEVHKGRVEDIADAPAELVELITRQPWEASQWSGDEAPPEMVEEALFAIPNDDLPYDDWLRVGMALCHWDDAAGYALFDRWSQQSSKYDGNDLDRRWQSFGVSGALGVGTIFHLAKEHGYTRPSPPLVLNKDGTAAAVERGEFLGAGHFFADGDGYRINVPSGLTPPVVVAEEAAPVKSDFWKLSTGEVANVTGCSAPSLAARAEPPAPAPAPAERSLTATYQIKLPGWAGAIYDFIYRKTMSPQPGAIAAAALQLVSIAGWGVRMYNDASPNLLTFVIAESGSGKDDPQKFLESVVRDVLRDQIESDIRSDKDLILGLVDGNARAVYVVDEAHTLLAAIGNEKAMHMQQLGGQILQLATRTRLDLPRKWREDLLLEASDKVRVMRSKLEKLEAKDGVFQGPGLYDGGADLRSAAEKLRDARIELEALEAEAQSRGGDGFLEHEAMSRLFELRRYVELNEDVFALRRAIKRYKERSDRIKKGFQALRFNLLCSSTPRNFNKYINADAIEGGLAGRSLIFDCGRRIPEQTETKPAEDLDTLKKIHRFVQELRLIAESGDHQVTADDGALEFFHELYIRYNSEEMREDSEIGPVNRRVRERVFAVASILATGMPMQDKKFVITREVAQVALDLVEMSTNTSRSLLKQSDADDTTSFGELDAMKSGIARALSTTSEEKPMSRSNLRKYGMNAKLKAVNMRRRGPKTTEENDFFSQTRDGMIEAGLIAMAKGARKGVNYYLTEKGKQAYGYDKSL